MRPLPRCTGGAFRRGARRAAGGFQPVIRAGDIDRPRPGRTGTLAAVSAEPTEPPLRQRLRAALLSAMKSGDRAAAGVLRSTLAAVDNAEAVDRPATTDHGLAIERTPVGVGAAEVPRRVLTEERVADLVRREISEREAAARAYDEAGQPEQAARLRTEAQLLNTHLIA
jgi:uncharacterized protein YqeY